MNNNFKKRYIQILSEKIHRKQRMVNEDPTLGYMDANGNWVNSEGDVEQSNYDQQGSWVGPGIANRNVLLRSPMSPFEPKMGGGPHGNPVIVNTNYTRNQYYIDGKWYGEIRYVAAPGLGHPNVQLPPGFAWVQDGSSWVIRRTDGLWNNHNLTWHEIFYQGRTPSGRPIYPPDWPPLYDQNGYLPNTFPVERWGELPDQQSSNPVNGLNPFNQYNWPILFGANGLIHSVEQLMKLIINFGIANFGYVSLPNGNSVIIDWPYGGDGISSLRNLQSGSATEISTAFGGKLQILLQRDYPGILQLLESDPEFMQGYRTFGEVLDAWRESRGGRGIGGIIPNIITNNPEVGPAVRGPQLPPGSGGALP